MKKMMVMMMMMMMMMKMVVVVAVVVVIVIYTHIYIYTHSVFISLRLMPPAFAGLEIASSMARIYIYTLCIYDIYI